MLMVIKVDSFYVILHSLYRGASTKNKKWYMTQNKYITIKFIMKTKYVIVHNRQRNGHKTVLNRRGLDGRRFMWQNWIF